MNRLPRLASAVLHTIGIDAALIGDLEEASRAGRSRFWCWSQVAGIVLFGSAPPFVIGWSTLLITFALFHMAVAGPLWITARQTGHWIPFQVAWLLGGYASFALAAWFVTRFHRGAAAAGLIRHTARVVLVIVIAAIIIELCAAAVVLLAATAPAPPQQVEWSDPSPHQATLVTVEDDVRLEVLDWGGSGPALLLLTGLGDTAHVFDDVAPMLATRYRVVGMTRRGHPRSSAPASEYTSARLAEDVVHVMDAVTDWSAKMSRVTPNGLARSPNGGGSRSFQADMTCSSAIRAKSSSRSTHSCHRSRGRPEPPPIGISDHSRIRSVERV